MNKVFSLLLLSSIIIFGCGKAKSPTGGPQDKEALKIVSIFPDHYGSLSDKEIEITFNKEVDKASSLSAFRFYPPLESFDVKTDDNVITLLIKEQLLPDRNYFLTISSILKDTRNNLLENNITYTYSNGKLQDSRLFGDIIYTEEEDKALEKKFILLDQDSVTVFVRNFTNDYYDIDGLEYRPYILRSYIDKNNNGRYDIEKEPYFEKNIDSLKTAKVDILLSYADTSRVLSQRASAINNSLVEISLSEELIKWDSLSVRNEADSTSFPYTSSILENDKLYIITPVQDTLEYRVSIFGLRDKNENLTQVSRINFKGSTKIDSLALELTEFTPKNGSTVTDSKPQISLRFNKIVLSKDIKASLKENETNKEIDFDIIASNSFIANIIPKNKLKNFNSYTFTLKEETQDFLGNKLKEALEINFMVTELSEN